MKAVVEKRKTLNCNVCIYNGAFLILVTGKDIFTQNVNTLTQTHTERRGSNLEKKYKLHNKNLKLLPQQIYLIYNKV